MYPARPMTLGRRMELLKMFGRWNFSFNAVVDSVDGIDRRGREILFNMYFASILFADLCRFQFSSVHFISFHFISFHFISFHFNSTQLNSTQLNSTQLNSTQLNSTQLNSTQLNSTQLNSTQLNSTQLNSTQLNSIHFNSPLSSVTLDRAVEGCTMSLHTALPAAALWRSQHLWLLWESNPQVPVLCRPEEFPLSWELPIQCSSLIKTLSALTSGSAPLD